MNLECRVDRLTELIERIAAALETPANDVTVDRVERALVQCLSHKDLNPYLGKRLMTAIDEHHSREFQLCVGRIGS